MTTYIFTDEATLLLKTAWFNRRIKSWCVSHFGKWLSNDPCEYFANKESLISAYPSAFDRKLTNDFGAESNELIPDSQLTDYEELCYIVEKSIQTATKETHYYHLDEHLKPIWDFIHNKLNKTGFKNGEPEVNAKNENASFWWKVYGVFSNTTYSRYLPYEPCANHHASAKARLIAFRYELDTMKKNSQKVLTLSN